MFECAYKQQKLKLLAALTTWLTFFREVGVTTFCFVSFGSTIYSLKLTVISVSISHTLSGHLAWVSALTHFFLYIYLKMICCHLMQMTRASVLVVHVVVPFYPLFNYNITLSPVLVFGSGFFSVWKLWELILGYTRRQKKFLICENNIVWGFIEFEWYCCNNSILLRQYFLTGLSLQIAFIIWLRIVIKLKNVCFQSGIFA